MKRMKVSKRTKPTVRIPRWAINWAKAAGYPPGAIRPIAALLRDARKKIGRRLSEKEFKRLLDRATPGFTRDIKKVMKSHKAKKQTRKPAKKKGKK